jgi:hypothetical protein
MGSSPIMDYIFHPYFQCLCKRGTGMWIDITVILLFLLFSLGVWRSFTSGVLREMIEFSKLAGDIKRTFLTVKRKHSLSKKTVKKKPLKSKR